MMIDCSNILVMNSRVVVRSLLFVFCLLQFSNCKNDDIVISLQQHISENPTLTPFNELIACAAGGQTDFLDDANAPLNMFFYPLPDATDFKYYETQNASDDPSDLSLFYEKKIETISVFNGFLRRFPLPPPDKDVWGRVSFIANDTLWYCKPVRYKTLEKPSQYAPELCEVDLVEPLQPTFTWQDGIADDNIIYFQIISDEDGNALSGTYTTERSFQFYNLGNVVLNVTSPNTTPTLISGKTYDFTLMGVSSDNWVNLIMDKKFIAQ